MPYSLAAQIRIQDENAALYHQDPNAPEITPVTPNTGAPNGYPILRFPAVPESVVVHVIDRPGMPFLGTGEAAQGPTAAAIANAAKVRIRELPLSMARVKAAIGA